MVTANVATVVGTVTFCVLMMCQLQAQPEKTEAQVRVKLVARHRL